MQTSVGPSFVIYIEFEYKSSIRNDCFQFNVCTNDCVMEFSLDEAQKLCRVLLGELLVWKATNKFTMPSEMTFDDHPTDLIKEHEADIKRFLMPHVRRRFRGAVDPPPLIAKLIKDLFPNPDSGNGDEEKKDKEPQKDDTKADSPEKPEFKIGDIVRTIAKKDLKYFDKMKAQVKKVKAKGCDVKLLSGPKSGDDKFFYFNRLTKWESQLPAPPAKSRRDEAFDMFGVTKPDDEPKNDADISASSTT